MLSEISQVQKDKGHVFSLICGRQIQKINQTDLHMFAMAELFEVTRGEGRKGKENDRE
jgi:hypothetical protein